MKSSSNLEFPICNMTLKDVLEAPVRVFIFKELTLEDYYKIEDSCNSLERLRNYQLSDILGKYKLF